MRLAVFSHKVCWCDRASSSGYATDGGFPSQMSALAELFSETHLVLPLGNGHPEGLSPLEGNGISVVPLSVPSGRGTTRKLGLLHWLLRNGTTILQELWWADVVHTPIPGDVGTVAMLLAWGLRKKLLVRHCGNWARRRTRAEHFWSWFMERFAGGRNVMFATGGSSEPPSKRNRALRWIFATSLSERDLASTSAGRQAPRNAPRLIIACRQEWGKGTDIMIRCLAQLSSEFPGISLDVVGDGSARRDFEQLARECGIDRQVRFHGQVPHGDVLKLLREADLFCYPTASEGFPKVVLEALSCGLPVICTPVSVLASLIASGNGILVPEVTPDAVAGAVRRSLDPAAYEAMSQRAILVAREYSLERWRDTIAAGMREAWGASV